MTALARAAARPFSTPWLDADLSASPIYDFLAIPCAVSGSPPYRWPLERPPGDADWDARSAPSKNHPTLQRSAGEPAFSFPSLLLTAPNVSAPLLLPSTPIRVCAAWHPRLARVASPFPRPVPTPTSVQSPAPAWGGQAEGEQSIRAVSLTSLTPLQKEDGKANTCSLQARRE